MKRLMMLLMVMLIVAAVSAVPAFSHVHLNNPSDECGRGNVPLGLTNPGGNDPQGNPQANDTPAPTKCR